MTPFTGTTSDPLLLSRSSDIIGEGNFPQGCEISPDGLCVLTSTAADNLLRLYNVHSNIENESSTTMENHESKSYAKQPLSWKYCLSAREGDSIRSYCWYPLMNSYNPATCAFVASSREQPIHLVDAYTSEIRASYRPYNGLDEMESPNVLTFTPDGSRIFASGFQTDRMIHVFDTAIPGRDSTILRLGKTRRSKDGQKGIVSALSFPSGNSMFGNNKVFAVGTYSPGSIYIYDDRKSSGDPTGTVLHGGMCVVGHGKSFTRKKRRFVDISYNDRDQNSESDNHDDEEDIFSMAKVNWYQNRARGGVTQLQWSTGSEFFLYSSSRHSDAVLAWDMRVLSGSDSHPVRGILSFPRESDTNQRLQFDLNEDGTKLYAGSQDKTIKIYDAQKGTLLQNIDGFEDAVNGISYKQESSGKEYIAVAVGARKFTEEYIVDEDGDVEEKRKENGNDVPGTLSLYQL